jgi:hypothetical protein
MSGFEGQGGGVVGEERDEVVGRELEEVKSVVLRTREVCGIAVKISTDDKMVLRISGNDIS